MRRSLLVASALTGLVLLGAGCQSAPAMGRYDVAVQLDPSLGTTDRMSTVEVDCVGVNSAADAQRWDNYSVTQYFTPGDAMRAGASRRTLLFRAGTDTTQTLSKADPIWAKWADAGAMQLYILAFLPGLHEDKAGSMDVRRIAIPLDKRRWNNQPIQVRVKESGITLVSAPKPEPK